MFSKHQVSDSHVPPERRFQVTAADFFLDNKLSAADVAKLFIDGSALDKTGDLNQYKKLCEEKNSKGKVNRNLARDLTRRFLRKSQWPEPDLLVAPCWSNKLQKEINMQIPVLMPHKIVMALAKKNPLDKLLQDTAMDRETKAHLDSVRIKLQADTALALGIWIDGVPFNNNRSESIEVFSLDFPGIDNLRVPMAAVPKKFMLSNNATRDFILQCITESLEKCAVGYCKDVGSIPKAVLCEVCGDWACFKSVFRLPGWQSKSGCCWKCTMTHAEVHQVGSRAFWRQPECRLDHWEILQRMLNQGNTICPLLMAPFVSVSIFRIDWLRCADLGVALEFLGSLFHLALPKMKGRGQVEQCRQLFLRIVEF